MQQAEHNAIDQRLPAGFDDVLADTDRRPAFCPVRHVDEHTGDRLGARGRIEDADLVVGQLDVVEGRDNGHRWLRSDASCSASTGPLPSPMAATRSPSTRSLTVASVSISTATSFQALSVAAAAVLGADPEALELKVRLAPASGSAQEQLKRCVGDFELVPLVLQALQDVDDFAGRCRIELDANLVGADLDTGLARHL